MNVVLTHEEFCDAFAVACDSIHRELHLYEHGVFPDDTAEQAMFSTPAKEIALAVLGALGIVMDEEGWALVRADGAALIEHVISHGERVEVEGPDTGAPR